MKGASIIAALPFESTPSLGSEGVFIVPLMCILIQTAYNIFFCFNPPVSQPP